METCELVLSCGEQESKTQCKQKEAGTLVHTVDTDVIVILIGMIHLLMDADIWVGFGMGSNFCHYDLNAIHT